MFSKELVSPEYKQQLTDLAEMLCNPERYRPVGQLALEFNNVVELHPVTASPPPEAA